MDKRLEGPDTVRPQADGAVGALGLRPAAPEPPHRGEYRQAEGVDVQREEMGWIRPHPLLLGLPKKLPGKRGLGLGPRHRRRPLLAPPPASSPFAVASIALAVAARRQASPIVSLGFKARTRSGAALVAVPLPRGGRSRYARSTLRSEYARQSVIARRGWRFRIPPDFSSSSFSFSFSPAPPPSLRPPRSPCCCCRSFPTVAHRERITSRLRSFLRSSFTIASSYLAHRERTCSRPAAVELPAALLRFSSSFPLACTPFSSPSPLVGIGTSSFAGASQSGQTNSPARTSTAFRPG